VALLLWGRALTDTNPKRQVAVHCVLKEELPRTNELQLLDGAAVLLQLILSSPSPRSLMERLVSKPITNGEGDLKALEETSSELPRAGIDMQGKGYQAIQTELLDFQHRLVTLRRRLPPNLKPLARQEILNSRGTSWIKVRHSHCVRAWC
jgi:hypothetical protein